MRGLKDQAIIWPKGFRLPERNSDEAEEHRAPEAHHPEKDGYYCCTRSSSVLSTAEKARKAAG
jgi:hypothetical protein